MTKDPCDNHATSEVPHTKDSEFEIPWPHWSDSEVYTINTHLEVYICDFHIAQTHSTQIVLDNKFLGIPCKSEFNSKKPLQETLIAALISQK